MNKLYFSNRLRKLAANDNPYSDVADPGVILKERLSSIPGNLGLSVLSDLSGIDRLLPHKRQWPVSKEYSASSLMPGSAGAYRDEARHIKVDDKLSGGKNKHKTRLSEVFGTLTSTVPAAILGGILMYTVSKLYNESPRENMYSLGMGATGSALGALALGAAGKLGGLLLSKGRTREEHKKYLEKSVLPNYLIPGVAGVNLGIRGKTALSS